MSRTRLDQIVTLLCDRMDMFLSAHGFERVASRLWLRKWGWKTDRVEIYLRGEFSVSVRCDVLIPAPADWLLDACYVGCVNAAWLGGEGNSFAFPTWPWSGRKFIDRIMGVMPTAADWYSRYDTPQGCLDHLADSDMGPKSRALRHSQEYLSSLPMEGTCPCCLLRLKRKYRSEYAQSIFDVTHRGWLPEPEADELGDDDD